MADPTVGDPICLDHTYTHAGTDFGTLPIPPLDPTFFDQDINFSFDDQDFDIEDLDFTLDDLYFLSDTEEFPNFTLDPDSCGTNQSDLSHVTGDRSSASASVLDLKQSISDQFDVSRALDSKHSESDQVDVSMVLDLKQSESGQVDVSRVLDLKQPVSGEVDVCRVLNCPSPELGTHNRDCSGVSSSQGSGNNCRWNESESANDHLIDSGDCARSRTSADSANNSINGVADKEIALEELGKSCLYKRKKENEDVTSGPRKSKHRRSNVEQLYESNAKNDEEEKKKARLIRNRESAQLSRQRKKHYVGELEDKLRKMNSTVHDLNAKISYIMSENASLKQQLSSSGMYQHPPMAPMAYPWVPYTPYFVNPQGSQVPLVPIPKLKPQQPVSPPKTKKVQSKKTEGKTKKVASVSFLGLLFFILLFGGLVPMVNVKYRDYIENKHYDQQHGTLWAVNGHLNGTSHNLVVGYSSEKLGRGKEFTNSFCGRGQVGGLESNIEFAGSGNTSEPLFASLYVPRNDTLVKIDGNLIIQSVMATEKAMAASREVQEIMKKETSLVVAPNLGPGISIPGVGTNGRHPHRYKIPTEGQRALPPGSADNLKSTAAEGELRKWFREGLTGPMLSSGMCTEVFHFDVLPSSPGSVIPANPAKNVSAENPQNSNKGRNRRILHNLPIPLPGSTHNIGKERVGSSSRKENSHGNNSLSSMVVSVLVDPRETSITEVDGITTKKSLSRVFVVLLLDGVKYVTYSCVLPLMGSTPHLVTT